MFMLRLPVQNPSMTFTFLRLWMTNFIDFFMTHNVFAVIFLCCVDFHVVFNLSSRLFKLSIRFDSLLFSFIYDTKRKEKLEEKKKAEGKKPSFYWSYIEQFLVLAGLVTISLSAEQYNVLRFA